MKSEPDEGLAEDQAAQVRLRAAADLLTRWPFHVNLAAVADTFDSFGHTLVDLAVSVEMWCS